jgi:hypothetical protein
MQHYADSIWNYGATDNYNTEYTKWLHIDLMKDAYKSTNFKDKFTQMTLWLEWRMKVICHGTFITWQTSGQLMALLPVVCQPHIQMTLHPTNNVSLMHFPTKHGAEFFYKALQMTVMCLQNPGVSQECLNYLAPKISMLFTTVPVFHKIKFWNQDPYCQQDCSDILNVAHVRPCKEGK